MDDVIERMAAGLYGQGPMIFAVADKYVREHYLRQARAALRAVSETHRLVPVEPTEEMMEVLDTTKLTPEWCLYKRALAAAPDYTEADDG